MKLLVVTPTLGNSRWLAETVESVARCAPGALHVLVAPDVRLASLAAQFPGVRVLADPGNGMYAAINAGLAAGGDWDAFTYINDDDGLLPAFARVCAQAAQDGGEAMAYGGVRLIDVHGRRLGGVPVSHFPGRNRALYATQLEPVYQQGTVITRSAWVRIGGFDESLRFCGDSDYLARLCLAGVRGYFVNGEVAAFRLRPGQLTQNREAMDAERANVDAKLRLSEGVSRDARLVARVWFRLTNVPLYAERVRRHGWKRFNDVVEQVGRQ